MPDARLDQLLMHLLPRSIAREIFEPAWCDLHIAHLQRRARARSVVARAGVDLWFALAQIALLLDCWRLTIADAPRLARERRKAHRARPNVRRTTRPPQERLIVLLYHLRHAVRRLISEPAFTVAAVLTLALGVGANVAVFTVVEAVLLRPLPYADPDELVILNHRDDRTGITKEFIAVGDYVDLMARQKAFAALGAYSSYEATVYGPEEPYRVVALGATSGFLDALRVRPLLGRRLDSDDSRPGSARVIMLGYDQWQSRFGGDPGVIGRSIKVGQLERTIVGVAPRGLSFPPNAVADIIVPMVVPLQAPAERKSGWVFAAGRLKPGARITDAASDLAAVSRQLASEFPQSNLQSSYFPVAIRDAFVGSTRSALLLMFAAVAVVLLIACANVANLLLARSLARRREIAVRVALGAGRGRLALQLLSESLILALASSIVGLLIAHWGAKALVAMIPETVIIGGLDDIHINGAVLGFALLLTVATTMAFGLVALLTVRMENTSSVLVAGGRTSSSALVRRTTSGLVVAEVAFAVVLLFGAGLILRSFAGLMGVNPGFTVDNVATMSISLPADRYREFAAREGFYTRAFAAIRALPEVRDVGVAAVTPLTGNNWTVGLQRADQPLGAGERPPEVGWQAASGGYFRALRIPLVAGRLFDATDGPGRPTVVIVSEELQRRYFPNESAVGKRVRSGDGTAEIVGVVGSIRRAGLRDEPRADMYFPFETNQPGQTTLFVRTASDPLRPVQSMQRALKSLEPAIVFGEARSLASIASESVRVTQLVLWLLGVFAATALTLAIVGIYGVMSYVVRQRTREIGTRIALGAPRSSILWMVLRQGAAIAALGVTIGIAIAVAAARTLASILYGTSTTDPIVLLAAPLVLVIATLVACYIPARRAADVNPAMTLTQP